jgi:hypothetical protein
MRVDDGPPDDRFWPRGSIMLRGSRTSRKRILAQPIYPSSAVKERRGVAETALKSSSDTNHQPSPSAKYRRGMGLRNGNAARAA